MSASPFILILEPSSGDALVLEAAFNREGLRHPARVLRNTFELRSYLSGAGTYSNREHFPIPSLLLLDFTHTMGALSNLQWLSQHGFFESFNVIGMGTGTNKPALQRAFDIGMNGFFEKPDDISSLARIIADLEWVDDFEPKFPAAVASRLITKAHLTA